MTKATIRVPGLKVAVPLAGDALPRDLVPMEGPAGEPFIDLVLDGGSLTARAKVNGKNYRKMLKQVEELGAAGVSIVLQGVLEGAGFQIVVKAPRSAEPGGEPPQP